LKAKRKEVYLGKLDPVLRLVMIEGDVIHNIQKKPRKIKANIASKSLIKTPHFLDPFVVINSKTSQIIKKISKKRKRMQAKINLSDLLPSKKEVILYKLDRVLHNLFP
jgi:hypothetical protein